MHAITIDTVYSSQAKAKKLIALPEIKDYVPKKGVLHFNIGALVCAG